jgi:hypothetical protein
MEEDPNAAGTEDEKIQQILITNTFTCNDDFVTAAGISPGNPETGIGLGFRREQVTKYVLMYGADGTVFPGAIAGRKQNWLSMELTHDKNGPAVPNRPVYIPSSMTDVTGVGRGFPDPLPNGGNPFVTAERLSLLGLTKNAGF